MYTYVRDVEACLWNTIWNISYEYCLAVRIMEFNLISVLTLGIRLCYCFPVGVCHFPLCLVLCFGYAVGVLYRIYSCRGGSVHRPVVLRSIFPSGIVVACSWSPSSSSVSPYCMLSEVLVFSFFGPYSCLFCRMCVPQADCGLLVLMYRLCSVYLVSMPLPVCPTYFLLQELHFRL